MMFTLFLSCSVVSSAVSDKKVFFFEIIAIDKKLTFLQIANGFLLRVGPKGGGASSFS